ncbi:MAG: 50S ribosomal protein L27 [Candidatus Omnitrophica bacterium]|nr:50S ribosomal protein L27 [Candidatus Omnitrophota bacterium]MDD5553325.1 50S ribosomal protein L27 [Candidatus Omnitrophota bacterium]
MAGGKSTPKKDKMLKVSSGTMVKSGQILLKGKDFYKAGINVKGLGTLFSGCSGKVYFTRKKTSHGKVRTYLNVEPISGKSAE